MTLPVRIAVAQRIIDTGVVAIVRMTESAGLREVARALVAGGIEAIEFTMTTPGALKVLEDCANDEKEQILFGAGTVLDAETARAAILAGARFLVAPTFNPAVVRLAHRYDVAAIPGVLTPTEMLAAWECGADFLKVFPATVMGPQYLKDVLAPLPQFRIIPVGGVSLQNTPAFIQAGAAAVAVGSHLVSPAAVRECRWADIEATARKFVEAVRQGRVST